MQIDLHGIRTQRLLLVKPQRSTSFTNFTSLPPPPPPLLRLLLFLLRGKIRSSRRHSCVALSAVFHSVKGELTCKQKRPNIGAKETYYQGRPELASAAAPTG